MKRRRCQERWTCNICNCFQAILLRTLLSHYNKVHGNAPNFRVVCNVDHCPAIFMKYISLYKHVIRWHEHFYNATIEETPDDEFRNNGDVNDINDRFSDNQDLHVETHDDNDNSTSPDSSGDEFEMNTVHEHVCMKLYVYTVVYQFPELCSAIHTQKCKIFQVNKIMVLVYL